MNHEIRWNQKVPPGCHVFHLHTSYIAYLR